MAALLLAAQPAMADNPRKVAVGPGAAKGAVLFSVPPAWIDHLMLFQREGDTSSTTTGYWVRIKARLGTEERFIVEALPPGRYWLEAVYQQDKWVACLQSRTMTLTLVAGEIAYLGHVDTRPTLASIQRNAQARKHLRASTTDYWNFYRTNVAAPDVTGRDAAGLAEAERFVRQQMPKSSATPRLADLQWGPHANGKSLSLANRCGWGNRD